MRPTRAKNRALCPDCMQEVGAVKETFNRSADYSPAWRLTIHQTEEGGRCWGSRSIIAVEGVYERDSRLAS